MHFCPSFHKELWSPVPSSWCWKFQFYVVLPREFLSFLLCCATDFPFLGKQEATQIIPSVAKKSNEQLTTLDAQEFQCCQFFENMWLFPGVETLGKVPWDCYCMLEQSAAQTLTHLFIHGICKSLLPSGCAIAHRKSRKDKYFCVSEERAAWNICLLIPGTEYLELLMKRAPGRTVHLQADLLVIILCLWILY